MPCERADVALIQRVVGSGTNRCQGNVLARKTDRENGQRKAGAKLQLDGAGVRGERAHLKEAGRSSEIRV